VCDKKWRCGTCGVWAQRGALYMARRLFQNFLGSCRKGGMGKERGGGGRLHAGRGWDVLVYTRGLLHHRRVGGLV